MCLFSRCVMSGRICSRSTLPSGRLASVPPTKACIACILSRQTHARIYLFSPREIERSQRIRPAFAYNSQTNIHTHMTTVQRRTQGHTNTNEHVKMHRNATRVTVFIEKNLILSVQWLYQRHTSYPYVLNVKYLCIEMRRRISENNKCGTVVFRV